MLRLLWLFFILSALTRIFARPPGRGAQKREQASSPGGDAGVKRRERERFEFQKRRARESGAIGYIWRAGKDCPRHKQLEGRFVPWDNPPVVDGVPAHAGELPGCTCTMEIVR